MVVVWDYDWSIVQRMNECLWETTTREKLRYIQAKMHIAYTIISKQREKAWTLMRYIAHTICLYDISGGMIA